MFAGSTRKLMLFTSVVKPFTPLSVRWLSRSAPLNVKSIYTTEEEHKRNGFHEMTRLLRESKQELIDHTAYRGTANRHALWTLRDIHLAMRENYTTMIETVGHNIFPVIIASDSEKGFQGVGGTFSLLLKDGTERHLAPTPFDYEMYKAVSHMPLGIFTIVSPYFRTPKGNGWITKLAAFQTKVLDGMEAIRLCEFSEMTKSHFLSMMKLANDYIVECLAKRTVYPHDYERFAALIYPLIAMSMQTAANLQVNHTMPALQAWKDAMGDEWNDVYVIIPTVWPVAGNNPRLQIFKLLMKPEKFRTNVILAENARSPDDMRTTLGRVVADRALAQMVFGSSDQDRAELTFSLSTPRDIITNACDVALQGLGHCTTSKSNPNSQGTGEASNHHVNGSAASQAIC